MAIRGSCHCGAVAYSLNADPTEAMECNCSICQRRGYLLTFAPVEQFTLETSRDTLKAYTFGKERIQHLFCTECGCAPFGEGAGPDGKQMVAINLRCAEDFDLGKLKINHYDGAHA